MRLSRQELDVIQKCLELSKSVVTNRDLDGVQRLIQELESEDLERLLSKLRIGAYEAK